MEPRANILKNISSQYILEFILYHLKNRAQLKIFNYSKEFQTKLGINIFSYQNLFIFKEVYSTIKKGDDKIEINFDPLYDEQISLLDIFERKEIKDRDEQKKLLNNLFLDLYQRYSKNIYIVINETIQYEYFLDLISINAPIKIKLKLFENSFTVFKDDEDKEIQKYEKPEEDIMKILDCSNKLNGIEFNFHSLNDEEKFERNFLDTINKLNNLEEIRIPCDLFSELETNNYHDFFKNKFKIIEVFTYYEDSLLKFYSSLNKVKSILKNNNDLIELKIQVDNKYPKNNFDEKISLIGMSNIKQLYLDELYTKCEIDNDIANKLINLYINHTFMEFKDKSIQFSNLKILNIENIFLSIFFNENVDFSFPSLESLSIVLKSHNDYRSVIKMLNLSYNLIEFELINYIKGENDDDNDILHQEDDFEDDEKYLKKISKQLLNAIIRLNNLKSLRIINSSYIDHITNLIELIVNTKFKKLLNLRISCLSLNEINQFIQNNPFIEKIDCDITNSNDKKIIKEKNFNFIINKNINIKEMFLNFDIDKYLLHDSGSINVNPSTLQVIKLKNVFICDSAFNIFIDSKILFGNLVEFKLKNDNLNDSSKEKKQNILMKFVENFKSFPKLENLSITDNCIDVNFINNFMKKNYFNLTKLKLETLLQEYRLINYNDYFINLYTKLKSIEKLKIYLSNEESPMDIEN